MADMTRIKGRIAETIYPNGTGAITAESHQALLLEMVDDINMKKADQSELIATKESLNALEQKVDNLPQGEEFDKQGNYPLLHVGTADDLAGRGESVPASFGFRASGGKSIKDGRAYIKAIKGNSVVWNNIAEWRGVGNTNYGITVTYDNGYIHVQGVAENTTIPFYSVMYDDMSKSGIFIKNHRYMVSGNGDKFYLSIYGDVSISGPNVITEKTGESVRLTISSKNLTIGEEINETFPIRVVDLTKMFGAGNEPTTIEDFNARVATLGVDMNAYNEGQVIHCNTESIKSIGDNAWDEEWEVGTITEAEGIDYPSTAYSRTRGYVKVIGGEQYAITSPSQKIVNLYYYDGNKNFVSHKYLAATLNGYIVTIPSNCQYMRFIFVGLTYNNDIMLTLVHSGWKQDTDAGYQPYWADTLPLPIIRKYFPDGMKLAGSAHDEIRYNKASGKWEYSKGRIKSVDLGTFNWIASATSDSTQKRFVSLTKVDGVVLDVLASDRANMLCKAYATISANDTYLLVKGIALRSTGDLVIYDNTITNAESLVSSLQGVILYYEAAEWEWVELDAEDQNFRDYYQVADFGTEMSQSNNVPSAAFSADIIYQFNAVDMIREHEAEINELQSIIATMQAQLTSLINGGQ
jgi:hypothetical protein